MLTPWEKSYDQSAAAAAKSLQLYLTLCDPIDGSPPGSRPWDSPGKNTGVGSMTNLDSILKNRDITLTTNVHLVKAIVFSVGMYGCENWTIKKAECRRIDDFELQCWRRLLSITWTARRSNQSILKDINPEYSLEGLMLKLKLQNFGHLMGRTDLLEKTLIEGRRRRGQQRMKWYY